MLCWLRRHSGQFANPQWICRDIVIVKSIADMLCSKVVVVVYKSVAFVIETWWNNTMFMAVEYTKDNRKKIIKRRGGKKKKSAQCYRNFDQHSFRINIGGILSGTVKVNYRE